MLRALRFQIAKDTSEERAKFISDYLREQKLIRWFLLTIDLPSLVSIKALLLLFYGCSRTLRSNASSSIALWWTQNELRFLESYLAGLEVEFIKCESRIINFLYFLRIARLNRAFQNYRIAKMIGKRHSFVVAARAMETILFYQSVSLDNKNYGLKSFFSSTQSHPYFSALNELSRLGHAKLCFLAHSPWVLGALPIHCDFAVFWGPAGASQFVQCGSYFRGLTFFYPQKKIKPAAISPKNTVLISLSKNPDWNSVRKIFKDVKYNFPKLIIQLRKHPNTLFSVPADLQQYVSSAALPDELSRSKFMIAGNSTVHLESFYFGVPTFWAPQLDGEKTSPLEFFASIPIWRIEKIYGLLLSEVESLYPQDTFQKVREGYFAETSKEEVRIALREFQAISGHTFTAGLHE